MMAYHSHDPALAKGTNKWTMIVEGNAVQTYRSERLTGNTNHWRPTSINGPPVGSAVDSLEFANGSYYAVGANQLFISDHSRPSGWTNVGESPIFSDGGLFFDSTTGTYHLYYEMARASHSGTRIGYATSSDAHNWTTHGAIYDPPGDWKVGDFDVIRNDGRYWMVADWTKKHPDYNVSLFVADSPAGSWKRVGNITGDRYPGPSQPSHYQDATLAIDESGQVWMFAQANREAEWLHAWRGDMSCSST
jgi:hypothetical protein